MGSRPRTERLAPRHRWDRYASPEAASPDSLLDVTFGAEDGEGDAPAEARQDRRRWVPSTRLAGIVVALLGACAGLWWWSASLSPPDVRPVDAPDSAPQGKTEGASTKQATTNDGGTPLKVHVAGAVARPGVFTLPRGSRIHEAIAAAGGATAEADQDRLNLASPIEDGVRIVVPRRDDPLGAPGDSMGGASSPSQSAGSINGKVNLNTATVEELSTLPRVGQVLALRITQYRTQHGRFMSVEDLDAIPGIGPAMLESLRPLVTV